MNKGPMGERHFEDFRKEEKVEEGGLVRLSGSFLLAHEEEILNLVNHEGSLAEKKNAAHRISGIKKADGGIAVVVTEHNLAVHIGKALQHAYKGKHEVKFLPGEKFAEVDWRRD